jgi:uncharacterized protein (DUF2384 family)
VSGALTSEQRLEQFDREVEDLKLGFIEALEQVRQSPAAGRSIDERWQLIARRMKQLREGIAPDDYDKEQVVLLGAALLDIRDLLDEPDAATNLDVADGLLVALERIRHVVRDAIDEHVGGVASDTGVVMGDLDRWLPGVPDHAIAKVLGVDRRTLTRWRRQAGPPRRDLRIFARLVAILRHNWDEQGIIAWFERPRRELANRKPATVLHDTDDPDSEAALIDAARSGRSHYAT